MEPTCSRHRTLTLTHLTSVQKVSCFRPHLGVLWVGHCTTGPGTMLPFMLLYLTDWHTVSIQRLFEATDGSFRLIVVLDNVTLQSMYCSPIYPSTSVMVANQIHLNGWDCRMILGAVQSEEGPDATIQRICAFTMMVSVGESFRHLIWMCG